jgi:hypothetical protein
MKYLKIYLIIIFCPGIIFSQLDSTRLDFYPIHIGDSWQFIDYCVSYDFYYPDTFNFSYLTQEITTDTVMPNGKKYYCFIPDIEYGDCYRRVDSINYQVLEYDTFNIENNYETVIYDLSILDSTRWQNGRDEYYYIGTTLMPEKVGQVDLYRIQTWYDNEVGSAKRIAQGIGLCFLWGGDAMVQCYSKLVWAKINGVEYGQVVSIPQSENHIPENNILYQNYPNPFNAETIIKIFVYRESMVSLSIYDLRGRFIENLVDQRLDRGNYLYKWNVKNKGSGLYIYQMKTEDGVKVRKCLLIK